MLDHTRPKTGHRKHNKPTRFTGMRAKNYEYRDRDGNNTRNVIALNRADQKLGFMEYEQARAFAHLILSLVEQHDAERGGTQ